MSRPRRPPSSAPLAAVRNDSVESPTWLARGMRIVNALRADGWQSTLGGLGGRSDRGRPGSVNFVAQPTLTDYELSEAYRNLWLVKRMIDARPDEALREGFGVDPKDVPEFMRLNYEGTYQDGVVERALKMADLKGGAGVFIGYANALGPEGLLEPAPEGEGAQQVEFLEVFDKFQLQGEERDRDTWSPTFDQPTIWQVTGSHRRTGMRFHTSRLIKFKGAPIPGEFNSLAERDRDWGDSVLQGVWTDVQRYGVFWQSVGHLVQISSIGVLKLAGLIEMLASKSQDAAIARVELLNEAMSITRNLLLDAKHDESYERQSVSFTDMPALLDKLEQNTAGALGIPATKLFGRAPAGMNATGESDLRNWYDDVECYRQRKVKPGLAALLQVTDGVAPDEIDFPPLWQESDAEQAQTRKVENEADQVLWAMGVASPAEIRKARYEGKPLAELLKGEPPEEAGPVQQANAQASALEPDDDDASEEDVQAAGFSTDEDDGVELSEAAARVLIASGGWVEADGGDVREDAFRPPRNYKKGPRGGFYYVTAGGKKVYLRKREPEGEKPKVEEPPKPKAKLKAEPPAPPKPPPVVVPPKPPKRSPEDADKARKERAKARRAQKKAEQARAEREASEQRSREHEAKVRASEALEASRAAKYEAQAVARGEPQTRVEAEKALRKHVDNLAIGPNVRDHEVVNAYHELKDAGIDKLFGGRNPKLPHLVLGASPVADHSAENRSVMSIRRGAGGTYGNPQLHSTPFHAIKMNESEHDWTPKERARLDGNRDAVNEWRRREGKPLIGDDGLLPGAGLGAHGFTPKLIHEFGHAVHLERIGEHYAIDQVISRTFRENRQVVSEYGETNHREYFAESFHAYRKHRAKLKAQAPAAHKMVEDVLRLRGIPLAKDDA